jgi:hypothetical protein
MVTNDAWTEILSIVTAAFLPSIEIAACTQILHIGVNKFGASTRTTSM